MQKVTKRIVARIPCVFIKSNRIHYKITQIYKEGKMNDAASF
jgi:hypothetical protein